MANMLMYVCMRVNIRMVSNQVEQCYFPHISTTWWLLSREYTKGQKTRSANLQPCYKKKCMLQAHYLLDNTASRLLCKEVHYSNMFLWSIQTALLLIAALSAMAAPPPLLSLKPPAPGSPIAGILDHLTVLKPGSGSGNGVHYQLISCRQSAAAIAAASPAIQNALKALVSSLDEVVDSMAASVNLTSSVVSSCMGISACIFLKQFFSDAKWTESFTLWFSSCTATDCTTPRACISEHQLHRYTLTTAVCLWTGGW